MMGLMNQERFFFSLFLFFFVRTLYPATFSETLVMTSEGFLQAQELELESILVGCNFKAQEPEDFIVESSIIERNDTITYVLVQIQTATGVILSPLDQYFYDPLINEWIVAKELTPDNFFLTDDLKKLAVIDVQEIYAMESSVCALTLAEYHTFFISDGCSSVLVHNAPHHSIELGG